MKVWVKKGDFEFLKSMQDEARTAIIVVGSFKRHKEDVELELK